jgi:structure-specific recognition protein 1
MKCEDRDLCIKGWNWGTAKFKGKVLTFDISGNPCFELPLNQVSNCTTGKNEVIMEFHQVCGIRCPFESLNCTWLSLLL